MTITGDGIGGAVSMTMVLDFLLTVMYYSKRNQGQRDVMVVYGKDPHA